ncbi:hypothetical protein NLG97_g7864 [Lecanicillium saksenae]|uniref:Uncharacterized protein n=1 Tax=Lecanicillium saksenae TaxID=468837 RepID=A0ACC1QKN2_9HYPO|nr:hypothetical protein NLG97_g7864 [Lecanicillium saksenae]
MEHFSHLLISSAAALEFGSLRDNDAAKRIALVMTHPELLTKETRQNLERDITRLGHPSFPGGRERPPAGLLFNALALLDMCADLGNDGSIHDLMWSLADKRMKTTMRRWLRLQLVGANGTRDDAKPLTIKWSLPGTTGKKQSIDDLELSDAEKVALHAKSLVQLNQDLSGLTMHEGELILMKIAAGDGELQLGEGESQEPLISYVVENKDTEDREKKWSWPK